MQYRHVKLHIFGLNFGKILAILKNFCEKFWRVEKKSVPLHRRKSIDRRQKTIFIYQSLIFIYYETF